MHFLPIILVHVTALGGNKLMTKMPDAKWNLLVPISELIVT